MGLTKNVFNTFSIKLQVDISKNLAVGYDGNLAPAGGNMVGLNSTNGYAGEMSSVDVLGASIGISGGAISAEDDLEVGAGGNLVVKTTGILVARALSDATGADEEIRVMLLPN